MWKTIQKRLTDPDALVSMILGFAAILILGIAIYNFMSNRSTGPGKISETGARTEVKPSPNLPQTYTVKDGDTLWSISENFYKTGYNWTDIRDTNKIADSNSIAVGQQLTIPDVKPKVVENGQISAASTAKPKDAKYTVKQGDSLWTIAVAEYGPEFGTKWTEIAQANALSNPDVIHTGNVLTLP